MRQLLILLSLFLTAAYCSFGSVQDSTATPVSVATETVQLMIEQQMQHIKDSIHKAVVKAQIATTEEVGKRRALEGQLRRMQVEDSLRIEQTRQKILRNKENAVGHPVVLGEDTVCLIMTDNGSFAAAERAINCSRKLKEVAGVYVPQVDHITVAGDNTITEILFGDRVLMTITLADALWEEVSQDSLAQNYARRMEQSIVVYQEHTSFMTILQQIGLSLLVLVVLFFSIKLVNRAFKYKLNQYITSKEGVWFKGFYIKEYELLNSAREVSLVLFFLKILRYIITLLLFYIALPMLFSIYPVTRRLADVLLGWILSPIKKIGAGFVEYIPNLLTVAVIWIVMRYVVRLVRYFAEEIENGNLKINGFYPDWAKATYNIVRILLYAFTFVMIFPYLPGSDSDVFKGVSVFIGVVFSLGSSSVIANMVAGMVITYMRPFKIGDHIKIGDHTGDVLEKTPFVTRIQTAKKEVITIPNATILASSVINYSTSTGEKGVVFHTTITIGYDVPWRKVHQMMIEAAYRTEYVLRDPQPYVLQTSLDDFYVSYQLCIYTKNPECQAVIYSQMHTNIQDVFNENGVEIMSPHYRADRDGNASTVSEK